MRPSAPFLAALAALLIVAALAFAERGAAFGAAALIGGFAGFALYHASFGFTGAWRRMARERRGAGLRAQMLLIALTCLVSYPLFAWGGLIGLEARGFILPMGVSSALGALVFGAGMQLGGGCASGTLFAAGGGSSRMILVLVFFVAGSFLATAHWEFWTTPEPDAAGAWGLLKDAATVRLNDNRGVSLIRELGGFGALAVILAFCAAAALLSAMVERRAHGGLEPARATASLLSGPWSLAAGAVALALVGIGALLTLGQPWGVTSAFALWGAKAWLLAGGSVEGWSYWSGWRAGQLEASLFADGISVMNFGIVAGAMSAAALAGKWAPTLRMSGKEVATAVIGGLMMGYGARLAYGCNIGAYLGGLVSGSLHGFWWLVWGFAGSWLGVALRARLSMDLPLAPRAQSA